MNTIEQYVDQMFANLPKTKQMEDLKSEILVNMEDKYYELKEEGRSENEAIGVVISEFGNIDELMKEFDISAEHEEKEEPLRSLTGNEVDHYLIEKQKNSHIIGIGVFLCILGPALLVLNLQFISNGVYPGLSEGSATMIGVGFMLILIAIAVGMFIFAGMANSKFNYIEDDPMVTLPEPMIKSLKEDQEEFQPAFIKLIIAGVTLCILSPVFLLLVIAVNDGSVLVGVSGMLVLIGIAVYIFIYGGSKKESYGALLQLEGITMETKKQQKAKNAVEEICWSAAVVIFLISGLAFNMWHINWLIFPITWLVTEILSSSYKIVEKNPNK